MGIEATEGPESRTVKDKYGRSVLVTANADGTWTYEIEGLVVNPPQLDQAQSEAVAMQSINGYNLHEALGLPTGEELKLP
jgi:hypothetical protein